MLRNTFEDHITYSQNFILFLFHLYSAFYHFFQVPTVYFSRIFKINKDDNYVEVHSHAIVEMLRHDKGSFIVFDSRYSRYL